MKRNLRCAGILAGLMAISLPQAVAGNPQFIDNMPQLAQDTDRPGAMIWQKPGFNRAAYTRVTLEPVTIFISPASEYQGLNADQLKSLSDRFTVALTKALEPEIPVIDEKGAGVLHVRAALTNMKISKLSRGLLSFSPFGLMVDSSAGPPFLLKDTSLEIELLDSMSGERMGVLVDKAPAAMRGEKPSWEGINKTLIYYAERFKARLDAAQKTSGSK